MNKEKYNDITAERAISNVLLREKRKEEAERKAYNLFQFMFENGFSKKDMLDVINRAHSKNKKEILKW